MTSLLVELAIAFILAMGATFFVAMVMWLTSVDDPTIRAFALATFTVVFLGSLLRGLIAYNTPD